MAETMGTREASELWGYSQATIANWCKEGRIDGAIQYKNRGPWSIPKNAECPKPQKERRKENELGNNK